MYSLVPIMLVWGGSTFFNLSLLTSDAYAILFGIIIFHKVVHTKCFLWIFSKTRERLSNFNDLLSIDRIFLIHRQPSLFYFIALAIIVGGLLLYNVKNEPQFHRPYNKDPAPESQTLTSNAVDMNTQIVENNVDIQRET
jgi:hypothetical protein